MPRKLSNQGPPAKAPMAAARRPGAAKQDRAQSASSPARAGFDPGSALAQARDVLWQDVTAVNEELFAFGRSRLQVTLERSESLLHCQNLEDVYQLQSDFASSTARQYIDESGRLMGLMTKLVLDSWSPGRTHGGRDGR